MRTVLSILIIAGAVWFFLMQKEENVPPPGGWLRTVPREQSRPGETPTGQPQLAESSFSVDLGRVSLVLTASRRGPVTLAGRVVDPAGAGVPSLALSSPEVERESGPLACDAKGRFTLKTTEKLIDIACANAHWMLIGGVLDELGTGEGSLLLVAARSLTCSGTVVDAAGRRIADAEVRLHGRVQVDGIEGGHLDRRTTTDADGNFDFGFVPVLAPTTLDVEAPGYVQSRTELQVDASGPLRIELGKR